MCAYLHEKVAKLEQKCSEYEAISACNLKLLDVSKVITPAYQISKEISSNLLWQTGGVSQMGSQNLRLETTRSKSGETLLQSSVRQFAQANKNNIVSSCISWRQENQLFLEEGAWIY